MRAKKRDSVDPYESQPINEALYQFIIEGPNFNVNVFGLYPTQRILYKINRLTHRFSCNTDLR
jgi:hypothetical protein